MKLREEPVPLRLHKPIEKNMVLPIVHDHSKVFSGSVREFIT